MKPKANSKGTPDKSNVYDQLQTPPYALAPVIPYLKKKWMIWEPACGDGYLVQALSALGYKVEGTDLLTGQNFFHYVPNKWHVTITNPPYSIKYSWIEECLLLNKPFALLLPLETLGAWACQSLMIEYGIENFGSILLSPRVNFILKDKSKKSSAQFPTFWFTYKLGVPRISIYRFTKEEINGMA